MIRGVAEQRLSGQPLEEALKRWQGLPHDALAARAVALGRWLRLVGEMHLRREYARARYYEEALDRALLSAVVEEPSPELEVEQRRWTPIGWLAMRWARWKGLRRAAAARRGQAPEASP
jgi:hypothetical protein